MYELRELLLKDNPGADEFWDGDPQHLTVTLLDGFEHTAQRLSRESHDVVLKLNAPVLLKEIRKYREAVAESQWDDAERLLESVDSLHTDLLVAYVEELNEVDLARARKVREGGSRSKRKKHPAIVVALRKLLKDNPAATNLELWKSFSYFMEPVETEAGRFDLDMDVFEVEISLKETRLYIYPVRKDGSRGPHRSIRYNTFVKKYAPPARKNL